jgi:hypothetical protein
MSKAGADVVNAETNPGTEIVECNRSGGIVGQGGKFLWRGN